MAEGSDEDESSKTEEPTQHRLDEAFKKGQIAYSKEVLHWMMLGTAGLTIMMFSWFIGHKFRQNFSVYLIHPEQFFIDSETTAELLWRIIFDFFLLTLPLLGFYMAAALAGGFLQTKFAISTEALQLKLDRLSPMKGLQRMFSKKSLVEFVKGLFKICIVGLALYIFFRSKLDQIEGLIFVPADKIIGILSGYTTKAIIIVISSMAVISIMDYLFQKFELLKSLRMTKDEVKREHKSLDGDPQIKHKRRQIAQQRIKMNLKEAVGRATAIVTNPTHFAVAIEYNPGKMNAPIVIAKGVDIIALKIRELAKEKDIPIYENPPLARALYASVDLEQEILPEHYQAVAEVIRFVMKLKKQYF
jgi:flagellar biosynthetic protein FlhB